MNIPSPVLESIGSYYRDYQLALPAKTRSERTTRLDRPLLPFAPSAGSGSRSTCCCRAPCRRRGAARASAPRGWRSAAAAHARGRSHAAQTGARRARLVMRSASMRKARSTKRATGMYSLLDESGRVPMEAAGRHCSRHFSNGMV
eukprot:5161823-Pleurochrysis_carterae.AAC.2